MKIDLTFEDGGGGGGGGRVRGRSKTQIESTNQVKVSHCINWSEISKVTPRRMLKKELPICKGRSKFSSKDHKGLPEHEIHTLPEYYTRIIIEQN